MNTQDIAASIEQLTASGKAYVIATVVRTEAPSSAKAGDRAVLDEQGILAGWVGGGCANPAVTRNALEALRDGRTRLIRISRDIEGLETGIIGYPMTRWVRIRNQAAAGPRAGILVLSIKSTGSDGVSLWVKSDPH